MASRDLYAVLGLKKGMGRAEVERAANRLLRLNHPSLNPGDAEASRRYDEILRAYEVLKNPATKKSYDRTGVVPGSEPARPAPARVPPPARPAADVYVTLSLSFREAVGGARREVAYEAGGVARTATIDVPPGVDTGSELKLPRPDGEPGSLVVVTNVAPHPFFRRLGNNLHCEVPIAVHEAALGARIDVPTLDGAARLKIPPGTRTGQKFRLRGLGVPSLLSSARGDQYVEVRVATPAARDVRVRQALRDLQKALEDYDEDPRADLEQFFGAGSRS